MLGQYKLLWTIRNDFSSNNVDRAWLRTADEAKKTQQTQVMLILKNISLPIPQKTGVYFSVMEVWRKAMRTLELLLQGMPQRVQEGEVLLGLSSWHLYPDMCALGAASTIVRQNDPLVGNGGIVTIGLQNADPDRDDGIYWSLPLAHLRYYGDPVMRTASAGGQSSRVSIDQLLLVTLGSVLSTWGKFGSDLTTPIEIIDTTLRSLRLGAGQGPKWIQPIAIAVKRFKDSHGHEREALSRLIHFGIRKCPDFIAEPAEHPPAMFGLADMHFLISQCTNMDSKLKCLRDAAKAFGVDNTRNVIIRYFTEAVHASSARYTYLNPVCRRMTKRTSSGTSKGYTVESESDLHWMSDPNEVLYDNPTDDSEHEETKNCIEGRRPFTLKIKCPLRPGADEYHYECEFVYGDPISAAVFRPIKSNQSLKPISNRVGLMDVQEIFPMQNVDLQLVRGQLEKLCYDRSSEGKLKYYYQSLASMKEALDIYERLPSATTSLQVTSEPLHCWEWSRNSHKQKKFTLVHAFACIAMFETGELDLDPHDLSGAAIMAISYGNSIYVAERMISDPTDILPKCAIRRIIGNIGRPGLSLLVPPQQLKAPKPDFGSWNMVNHVPFDGRMEDSFAGTSLHLSFSEYQLAIDVGAYGQRDQDAFFVEAIISVYDRGRWVADIDIMKTVGQWAYDEAEQSTKETKIHNAEDIEITPAHQDNVSKAMGLDIPSIEFEDYIGSPHDTEDAPENTDSEGSSIDWMASIELPQSSGDSKYAFEFSLDDQPNIIPGRPEQSQKIKHDAKTCIHSEKERVDLGHLMPLASIDSWVELLDPPLTNAIIRASENKFARLCTAAVAIQQGFNLHIAKRGICWQCEYQGCCSEEQHNARTREETGNARAAADKKPKSDHSSDPHHLFIC